MTKPTLPWLLAVWLLPADSNAQQLQRWPVEAPVIQQEYACYDCVPEVVPDKYHTGVDFTDALTPCNLASDVPEVSAVADGEVYRTVTGCYNLGDVDHMASCGSGWGNHVIIAHPNTQNTDFYTLYTHLNTVTVQSGESVFAASSTTIGSMGATGNVTGCHLHFGLLDFDPGRPGDFPDGSTFSNSGINAYTTQYPEQDHCGGSNGDGCPDPKHLVPDFKTVRADTNAEVHEHLLPGSPCVTDVQVCDHYVSLAEPAGGFPDAYYIFLPSQDGPAEDPDGDSFCTSQATHGWIGGSDVTASLSPTPVTVEVLGREILNQPLSVRSGPGTNFDPPISKAWGGQHFVAYELDVGQGCDGYWYRISIPEQRSTIGSSFGWVCGDFLDAPLACFPPPSCSFASLKSSVCNGNEDAPNVTTLFADNLTEESARLNMAVNPNNLATDAWFEWGTTASLGFETPRQPVGSGGSTIGWSDTLGTINCDTLYYFRAHAENSVDEVSGTTETFTTDSCGSGGGDTEDLELLFNGDFEDGILQWATTGDFYVAQAGTPSSGSWYAFLSLPFPYNWGNNLYGELFQAIGAGVPENAVSVSLSFWYSIGTNEPDPDPYDFMRIIVEDFTGGTGTTVFDEFSNVDATGSSYQFWQRDVSSYAGEFIMIKFEAETDVSYPTVFRVDDVSVIATVPVTPPAGPPSVTTDPADQIGQEGARLNLTVNPNGASTQVWFEWGTSPSSLPFSTTPINVGDGTTSESVSDTLTGLACDETYYFKAFAENTEDLVSGTTRSFSTTSCPGEPDLIVSAPQPDALPPFGAGQSISWSVTSTNQGDAASLPTNVGYYLGTTCQDFSYRFDQDTVAALDPDQSDDDLDSYVFQETDVGTRYVVSWVDYPGVVDESNESNNTNCFGPFTISVGNEPPSVTVIEPDGIDDSADSSYITQFLANDPDDDSLTIALYYDTDGSGQDGTLIVNGLSENDTQWLWSTSALPEGDYFIYAIASDGVNSAIVDYSSGAVSVSHPSDNTPPVAVDDEYTVEEDEDLVVPAPGVLSNDTDADGDFLSAGLVSFPSNGILTLSSDGSLTYTPFTDTFGSDSFTYWAWDQESSSNVATVTIDVLPVNDVPFLTFAEPNGIDDIATDSFTLVWLAFDSDNVATIDLSYSLSPSCSDSVSIASNLNEIDDFDSYVWNTSELPVGNYYIGAVISDGVAPAQQVCSLPITTVGWIFSDGFEAGDTTRWAATVGQPEPPNTFTLTVLKSGTGTGTVTSVPAGINCGADCTGDYNEDTLVALTANADVGSTFAGWSGGCAANGTVTMDADKSCTVTFDVLRSALLDENLTQGFATAGPFEAFGVNTVTLEAWIKPTGGNGTFIVTINDGNKESLQFHRNDGEYHFRVNRDSGGAGTASVPGILVEDGEWHNLAGTYDGSFLRIYLDCVEYSSLPYSGEIYRSQVPLSIGLRAVDNGGPWSGYIDEVRVWDMARTAADIVAWCDSELSGSEAGLTAYWKLNGNGNDSGPNGFDLLLLNDPIFVEDTPLLILDGDGALVQE